MSAQVEMIHKQRQLRHNLTERGVPISLSDEVAHILKEWEHEGGLKGRAVACLRELTVKADDVEGGRYYTEQEWVDREEEYEDQVSELRHDLEEAWSESSSWEYRADELQEERDAAQYDLSQMEDERDDLQEQLDNMEEERDAWQSVAQTIGDEAGLECNECGHFGCHADCQEYDW